MSTVSFARTEPPCPPPPRRTPRRRMPGRTPRRRMPRRGRRGLIGILLSIVVVVVIIIGVFSVYNQVSATATATQTAVFVRQLAPQITQRYRGDYKGITAKSVIGSGFVPNNWTEGDDKIEDPEGRDVTIAATNADASFTITFVGGVAEETCKAVLGALKSDRTFEKANYNADQEAADIDTTAQINTECEKALVGNFVLQFR